MIGPVVPRGGREQGAGEGMGRRRYDVSNRALFDDHARVHHTQAVADFRHHTEIVSDQQDRRAVFAAQLMNEPQDLLLHSDVERGGRLVSNDEFGIASKRDGDQDTLALAAGNLVRKAAQHRSGFTYLHLFQQRERAQPRGLGVKA